MSPDEIDALTVATRFVESKSVVQIILKAVSNARLNARPVGCYARRFLCKLLHQAVVQPHQLTVVVELQYQLSGANLGTFAQKYLGAEMSL